MNLKIVISHVICLVALSNAKHLMASDKWENIDMDTLSPLHDIIYRCWFKKKIDLEKVSGLFLQRLLPFS